MNFYINHAQFICIIAVDCHCNMFSYEMFSIVMSLSIIIGSKDAKYQDLVFQLDFFEIFF